MMTWLWVLAWLLVGTGVAVLFGTLVMNDRMRKR